MAHRSTIREVAFADLSKYFLAVDGMKYGADFVLYRGNVDTEHGFALVFVKEENETLNEKEKTIICRICESVKKKTEELNGRAPKGETRKGKKDSMDFIRPPEDTIGGKTSARIK
ncbi:tRNA intron endonuclease, putative [Plasmodium ovale curtisi]|uniref:tRNA-intron lyase n=1 Tax=Plasmodium ovale curtisi TaxID=864141 RepID=A0A1A8X018_PLAOA|nr:tRNA intron endonuclease, putative [Plasmodium ovale curtisi]SBS97014.1 tRNA intron endonuclease, putative [Plasmodium ovale curtisi]